jgi:hypothetical protein
MRATAFTQHPHHVTRITLAIRTDQMLESWGRGAGLTHPTGKGCSDATATVLMSAFPTERSRLTAMVQEARRSRMYAGLHFGFDCLAVQTPTRQVAEYVMAVTGTSRGAIPLD